MKFMSETPEAAEFMLAAMRGGLEGEDFRQLREMVGDKKRRAMVLKPVAGAKKKAGVSEGLEAFLDVSMCQTGMQVQNKERLLQRLAKDASHKVREISAEDAAVGEVLDRLANERDAGRLLTIVTADHGEGLGFRGEQTHAIYVYEPLVHVPLIVRWPAKGGGGNGGDAPAGAVRNDPVSVVDIFPTVLEAAGVTAPLQCDGVGLSRAPQPDRRVYSESLHPWLNHGWSPLYALSGAGLKYIHSTQPELYAVAPDSVEGDDLVVKRPGDVTELRGELQAFVREHAELGTADGDGRVELDSERQAVLKKIGYVGIDSRGIPLPEPFSLDADLVRATPERLERYTKATTPGLGFTLPQAIEELQKIVAEEPSEIAVLDCLGRLLVETKRTKEAHAPLERLLKLRPGHADGWGNLGACHQLEKEFDAAIACFTTAAQ
jgi:hypothetical protein